MVCCGFSFNLNVTKVNQQRSKTMIALTNRYFWLHFLIVLFNLGDLVKDITFTAAVQHFDTNIVQAYETETSTGDKVSYLYPIIILILSLIFLLQISRYREYWEFNVNYVFITSVSLILFSQLMTYLYWTMITRKPNFLMTCEHQGRLSRIGQLFIQYLPSTLPILLFAQDTSLKIALGEQNDSK